MLKILIAPNKVLNSNAEIVKRIDKKIKRLVDEMIVCLKNQKDPQGVGLAAPQVGYNLQLFIIKPYEDKKPEVFINPKILTSDKTGYKTSKTQKSKQARKRKLEGCLSIPKIWAPIKRAQTILIEYADINGNIVKNEYSGFESIIIQHEIDHLNGVMFTQRALEQKVQLYEETGDKLEKIIA